MHATLSLALLTARELVRRKFFYVLAIFGVALVLLSLPLTQLTIGQWQRIVTDVALGGANLVADLLAAILGATLISSDIERRSIYPILAAPISRWSIVCGRFLGLALILAATLGGMALMAQLLMIEIHAHPSLGFYQAWLGLGLEAITVAALALVFSCFSSSLAAAIFSVSFAVIARFTWNLDYFAQASHAESSRLIGHALALVLPNLAQFDFKGAASADLAVAGATVRMAVASTLAYVAFYVWLGGVIFSRRDLK